MPELFYSAGMGSLRDIVAARLKQLGVGPVEAATGAGIERTFIRDIVEGRKKGIRSDKMEGLARALFLDPAALARGELVPISHDEPPDDRTDETPEKVLPGDIPNLNIRGGLGIGSPEGIGSDVGEHLGDPAQAYVDHVSGFWSFPPAVKAGWRNMPQVYSIPVEGDSMEPTLTSGSYVFVDMTHTVPTPEDIYACDYGDGLTIKRLQLVPRTDKIRVMSDNARYSSYELQREDVRVYGRVVAWFQWRG